MQPDRKGRARPKHEDAPAQSGMGTVMQRDHELRRIVVDGRRTDDRTRCALVVVHERSGHWVLYPHGADQLGVRLPGDKAVTVARAILAGGS